MTNVNYKIMLFSCMLLSLDCECLCCSFFRVYGSFGAIEIIGSSAVGRCYLVDRASM